nr:MAG TPA: hypothetical protein [Caudoviricetes sp.]
MNFNSTKLLTPVSEVKNSPKYCKFFFITLSAPPAFYPSNPKSQLDKLLKLLYN